MSGPALNPLANIATTAKSADVSRSDTPQPSATDAADSGFARELQRHIDRDAKPATGASPASSAKTDGNPSTANTDTADAAAQAPEDGQAQPTDVVALLGKLLVPGNGAAMSSVTDGSAQPDTTQSLVPADSLPADPALAALLAAGLPPQGTPAVKLTPSAQETSTDKSLSDSLLAGKQHGNASLVLADAAERRQLPTDVATDGKAPGTALADTTAKLAATAESAGKNRDLTAETTTVNNFADVHAAALANLRGETTARAASPVPLHVATPAGSPGWPEEVGSRVSWMVGHDESHAQLTLTPPQLGKIEVSITVNGDQTSAQFVAATPAARELIEQSLPRLREVLEQSGINLGQTDVGTSSQSNNSGDGQQRGNSAWGTARNADDGTTSRAVSQQWSRRGDGLVDTFA